MLSKSARLTLASLTTSGLVVLAVACGDSGTTAGNKDMSSASDMSNSQSDMSTSQGDMASATAPSIAGLDVVKDFQKGGAIVKITGVNFKPGATVRFGTVSGNVTDVTTTQITVVVPANRKDATTFNNPGQVDVLVTNTDTQSATLAKGFRYYIETPAFANPIAVTGTDNGTRHVAAADLDQDGDIDLVTVNGSTVTVFANDGLGAFTKAGSSYTVGTTPFSVTVADLNGDTYPDLIVPNSGSNNLHVLINSGTKTPITFAAPKANTITGANQPQWAAVSDANNDGSLDILVVSRGTAANAANLHMLAGNKTDTFTSAAAQNTILATAAYTLVSGDFNQDGRIDVAVGHEAMLPTNPVTILLNDNRTSTPYYKTQSTNASGASNYGIAVAAFDNDTYLDLIVSNQGSNSIGLIKGSMNGTFTAPPNSVTAGGNATFNPEGISAGDVNGDGNMDAIAALNNTGVLATTGNVNYFLGNGAGGLAAAVSLPNTGAFNPTTIVTGDWNKDGRLDVAYTTRNGNGALQIRLGTGN